MKVNEFSNISTENLKKIKMNLESYRQGVLDTLGLIGEIIDKILSMYDEKIRLCQQEIDKEKHESDN